MAPQIDADRVSDRDDVHPGAVGDARDLVVPGDHADALAPRALHLEQRGQRDLGLHQNFSTQGRSSISQAQALRG